MKKFKHYIIYKITNLVNGKIYIGKHRCNDLDDGYFGSGKILWLAINKYGLENFEFHLEIDLKNEEEMDLLEQLVVNKDFLSRDDVYNISRGGKNPCMYGDKNPFYGKKHSEEFCQKISNQFKGKNISEEHKQKISKSLHKLYSEHPEIHIKLATKKGKKQCKNSKTGEIKFFSIDSIPDDFDIYTNRKPVIHVSQEKKAENKRKMIERNHESKWYNNGYQEKFCRPEDIPSGYVLGRLPTINVGRKLSQASKDKMSKAKIGKSPGNKGKVWITNGCQNQYVDKNSTIPDGWYHGMTHYKG